MCIGVCACVCTCIYRQWTHMCNVYVPRYLPSHLVQKYPSQMAGCLQSGGVFLLEILWPDTIPAGGLACLRCPARILSQHDRLQKEQGQSGTGIENTVPSKGHPLTHWDAKLQETLKIWKESCCLNSPGLLYCSHTNSVSQLGEIFVGKKKALVISKTYLVSWLSLNTT